MSDKLACAGCGSPHPDYCYRCVDQKVDQRDKNAAALNRVARERDEAQAEVERLQLCAQKVCLRWRERYTADDPTETEERVRQSALLDSMRALAAMAGTTLDTEEDSE